MEIIDGVTLVKALEDPEKIWTGNKPGIHFMRSSMINTLNKQMLIF